jgi:hypothetical protein
MDTTLFLYLSLDFFFSYLLSVSKIGGSSQVFMGGVVEEEDMLRIVRQLTRIVEILKVAAQQILVLTTMTPLDFLAFRNFLGTSSGFQSVRCAFFDRNPHSMMPLVPTPARLQLLQRVTNITPLGCSPFLPVHTCKFRPNTEGPV